MKIIAVSKEEKGYSAKVVLSDEVQLANFLMYAHSQKKTVEDECELELINEAVPDDKLSKKTPDYNSEQWTEEQITLLKDNYDQKTIEEIACLIGRTVNATYKYAQSIGLKRHDNKEQKYSIWTNEEDNYLRENHSCKTINELAKDLNRGLTATQKRCNFIGLRKKNIGTKKEEINQIKESFICECGFQASSFRGLRIHQAKSCKKKEKIFTVHKKKTGSVTLDSIKEELQEEKEALQTIDDSAPRGKPFVKKSHIEMDVKKDDEYMNMISSKSESVSPDKFTKECSCGHFMPDDWPHDLCEDCLSGVGYEQKLFGVEEHASN